LDKYEIGFGFLVKDMNGDADAHLGVACARTTSDHLRVVFSFTAAACGLFF
jgi:hypothetical protein